MSVTDATRTIVQEITINAPATKIFEALTDPERRKVWWGIEGRFQATHAESDLRIGGRWKMSGTGFGRGFTVEGEYRAIEPPRLLAFTWRPSWQPGASETLVRFELAEAHGVTTVRLTHSGLSPEGLEAHQGWAQILERLSAYAQR
jgi:uncharacterized protein YndB with AHSA1/START domain